MSVLGKIKVALDYLVFEGLTEFLVKPLHMLIFKG